MLLFLVLLIIFIVLIHDYWTAPAGIMLLVILVCIAAFIPVCPMQTKAWDLDAISTNGESCTYGVYDATPAEQPQLAMYMYSDPALQRPGEARFELSAGRVMIQHGDRPKLIGRRTHILSMLFVPTLVANFRHSSWRYTAVIPPAATPAEGPER